MSSSPHPRQYVTHWWCKDSPKTQVGFFSFSSSVDHVVNGWDKHASPLSGWESLLVPPQGLLGRGITECRWQKTPRICRNLSAILTETRASFIGTILFLAGSTKRRRSGELELGPSMPRHRTDRRAGDRGLADPGFPNRVICLFPPPDKWVSGKDSGQRERMSTGAKRTRRYNPRPGRQQGLTT